MNKKDASQPILSLTDQQKLPRNIFGEFLEASKTGESKRALELARAIEKSDYPRTLRDAAIHYISRHTHQESNKPGDGSAQPENAIVHAIERSDLFNWWWYSKNYSILCHSARECAIHYLETGAYAGCNPSEEFDSHFYLASNPDVRKSQLNPLYHFLIRGRAEGRSPLPARVQEEDSLVKRLSSERVRWCSPHIDLCINNLKTIAFYLPQFHRIPENDKWWGDGFTEWTNVKAAKPLFKGHEQPKLPGELGYYNLLNPDILRAQAHLASAYGVTGFCFYFYWFNGKTLLEDPLKLLLKDKSITTQFCLCWANENWTRAWDGLEKEVLIAQQHSPKDDLQFIKYVSKYLRDPRYIRQNGKPLLIVYRPSLLPSPKETTEIWRDFCRKNGIGEITIGVCHSFTTQPPGDFGCDLAIEFAPLNMNLRQLSPKDFGFFSNFTGGVYDWQSMLERSYKYQQSGYPLARCINPGWDNTARKKERASIITNCSPQGFLKLCENAIEEAIGKGDESGIIFINAWNEWAEGAVLEPTASNGYAYLSALRQALINKKSQHKHWIQSQNKKIALCIHAFYPDVLHEILIYAKEASLGLFNIIIISTPFNKVEDCNSIKDSIPGIPETIVIGFDNRGRDIRPFLSIIGLCIGMQINIICKIHTKKSLHRDDGQAWREEVVSNLLSLPNAARAVDILSEGNVGLLAPDNHMAPMGTYWGSNQKHVLSLGYRLGFLPKDILSSYFPAGSMFWARIEALAPLLGLIDLDDFEYEAGQTDGTLAHACERIFGLSPKAAGFDVGEISDLRIKSKKLLKYA